MDRGDQRSGKGRQEKIELGIVAPLLGTADPAQGQQAIDLADKAGPATGDDGQVRDQTDVKKDQTDQHIGGDGENVPHQR